MSMLWKIFPLIVALTGMPVNVFGQCLPDTIQVELFKIASFQGKAGEVTDSELSRDNQKFKISRLNSDHPVMHGNTGTGPLILLGRNGCDSIYLGEVTKFGGINLLSIFPNQKIIIWSKQYSVSVLSG